ncbi:hypothetical protein IV102_37735 [bacterium]|nr:hypothetical protein [bacterium]
MLALCLLTQICLAKDRNVLLVLNAQGSKTIASGSLLTGDQSLEVPTGCRVTLLVLGQGKRVSVTGPSTVTLKDGLLEAKGGTLVDLKSPVHKLPLTGENHRIVAGMVAPISRAPRPAQPDPPSEPPLNSPWKVEVLPENRLRLSRPAGKDGPPTALNLVFCVSHEPYPHRKQLQTLSGAKVEGVVENGRWIYRAEVPTGQPGKMGLRLQQPGEEFYVPVCSLSSQQAAELESFHQDCLSWARAEPNSIEPYVAYAAAAEEWTQLEQALAALEKALKIRPNAGLWRMAARIQIDMARYADAAKSQALAGQL